MSFDIFSFHFDTGRGIPHPVGLLVKWTSLSDPEYEAMWAVDQMQVIILLPIFLCKTGFSCLFLSIQLLYSVDHAISSQKSSVLMR